MRKTLLLFSLIGAFSTSAQEDPIFHWSKSAGNIGFDIGYGMNSDSQGNVYTVGVFNGTVDFNPGAGTSNMTAQGAAADAFVQKLDSQGNFVWAKRIGGSSGNHISHIGFAQNGDLILGGSFNETVDFDPNAGTTNLTAVPQPNPIYSSTDVSIVRLTAEGNLVWAKKIGGPGYEEILSMEVDAQGNVFVAGFFELSCDFDPGVGNYSLTATGSRDGFILKLDPDGNFVWAKRIGGASESRINKIVLDAQGNIYATGNYFQAIDVDPNAGQVMLQPSPPDNFNQYSQDAFVFKWNAAGEYQWANRMAGSMSESSYGLAVGNDVVYVSGWFYGSVDMDPGAGEAILSTSNGGSIFVCKYDTSGTFQWAKQTGAALQPEVRKIQLMEDGDLAMYGTFKGSFPFAPGMTMEAQGENDLFVARFDADGNPEWANAFGGTGDEYPGDINIASNGVWLITGAFATTSDLNPFYPINTATSVGSQDIFTVRLAPEALKTQDFQIDGAWSVYPNPSNGQVSLHFDEALFGAKVDIHTILGQKVSEYEIGQTETNLQLRPGNYIVKTQLGNSSSIKKLIVF
ncbi:T9SS type A sorting domain-containing protein [Flavobacterium sp. MAH-1]|uniref:T9SS type A sorting domain-containing protein n=2 Tax=Flavobacterium agri TaxID=2743471 RepID=A0A7Y9C6J2_9FLAO|nr:T9SS type A sorting domain-containing protein [Flavobacterium agri]NUY81470.1 T9SS type A sorting domain-containing protein [Flavobacterium agri]NYA71494.1 T9SS type A sorting domain-containing protein [Flavobacterium agri]